MKNKCLRISQGYFKMGDDFQRCLETERKVSPALRNWADKLQEFGAELKQMADLLENEPVTAHAGTHVVTIENVKPTLAEKLEKIGVAYIEEFDD